MKKRNNHRLISVVFLVIVAAGFAFVSLSTNQTKTPTEREYRLNCGMGIRYPYQEGVMEKMTLPLFNKLCFSEEPAADKPTTITFRFRNLGHSGQANATIFNIPEGFSLISGGLNWSGTLEENEEKNITAVIKLTKTGYHMIGASFSVRGYGGIGDIVYLDVGKDKASFMTEEEWRCNVWNETFYCR